MLQLQRTSSALKQAWEGEAASVSYSGQLRARWGYDGVCLEGAGERGRRRGEMEMNRG
jgi:hypothetical protein